MKSVALVGLAETTREAVAQSKADEIWTLNWAYTYDFIPRIDRLFEMHPIWVYVKTKKPEYVKPRAHWKWLHKPRPYPVYLLQTFPDIPNCIAYPIKEVTEFLFGNKLLKGGDPTSFYSSSIDYMLALAMYEGFERIELYGVEMGSTTEYRYQREGAKFFIGQAIGRGIEVYMPKNTILFHGKSYGYEGGQMIFRQDLERILEKLGTRRRDAVSKMQYLEGKRNQAAKSGEDITELEEKVRLMREEALIASAGEQTISYLIREIDLEEPELELVNPLTLIPME